MGNRAVITTEKAWSSNGLGIYMHWCGGRKCVEGLLEYCKRVGVRKPETDNYGWAGMCQVIGNTIGGSVGIDKLSNLDLDNGDNGVYIIKDWQIVDRKFHGEDSAQGIQNEKEMEEMIEEIDNSQPARFRLKKEVA